MVIVWKMMYAPLAYKNCLVFWYNAPISALKQLVVPEIFLKNEKFLDSPRKVFFLNIQETDLGGLYKDSNL